MFSVRQALGHARMEMAVGNGASYCLQLYMRITAVLINRKPAWRIHESPWPMYNASADISSLRALIIKEAAVIASPLYAYIMTGKAILYDSGDEAADITPFFAYWAATLLWMEAAPLASTLAQRHIDIYRRILSISPAYGNKAGVLRFSTTWHFGNAQCHQWLSPNYFRTELFSPISPMTLILNAIDDYYCHIWSDCRNYYRAIMLLVYGIAFLSPHVCVKCVYLLFTAIIVYLWDELDCNAWADDLMTYYRLFSIDEMTTVVRLWAMKPAALQPR